MYHDDKIRVRRLHDQTTSWLFDLHQWHNNTLTRHSDLNLMTFDTPDFLIPPTLESPLWPEYKQKWSHPDSNWGPKNQNLICCPYTMEPFTVQSDAVYLCHRWLFWLKNKGHNRNWTNDHGNCSPMLYRWAMRPVWSTMIDDFSLTRRRCWQKRPPWGSNPRPYG